MKTAALLGLDSKILYFQIWRQSFKSLILKLNSAAWNFKAAEFCEIPARAGGDTARDLHYREQARAARTQTSRSKFHKFRLFFHLDHVWDWFNHAFWK